MDYSNLGLNSNMRKSTALSEQFKRKTGYDFDSENERGAVSTVFVQDAAIKTAKIGTAQITDALIATVAAGKIIAGTMTVAVNVGTSAAGYVQLDGANNRIVVNDGTVDRIMIGNI